MPKPSATYLGSIRRLGSLAAHAKTELRASAGKEISQL
jgi:hypothetical protein